MKRFLIIFLLVLAGAGYYWFFQKPSEQPKPEAREVAPHRWQISTTKAPDSPTNETLAETNATTEENGTEENATNATAVPEDTVVGHGFVRDMSRYLVARYLPAGVRRNPSAQPRFDLNVKSLNIRYGADFPGLNVNPEDIPAARKLIFTHALNDQTLEFLRTAYTPLFLDSLERSLAGVTYVLPSGQAAGITEAQRAEMLGMLAARLRGIGRTVAVLARTDSIPPLVDQYLADANKVDEAHLAFWNRQAENATPAQINDASTQIKTAIQAREMSRQRLLQTIVSTANPQNMDASELIYLAQWVHRRRLENLPMNTVAKAGELLTGTAAALEERASQPKPELETQTDPETDNPESDTDANPESDADADVHPQTDPGADTEPAANHTDPV